MSKPKKKLVRDKHLLYSAAVQSADADLDFFQKIYKRRNTRPLRRLREDFCGTALLACEFVNRHKDNRAWGVDLDQPTLDWGRERYVSQLGAAAERLELVCSDVVEITEPRVQVVAAQNFSFCIFKTRPLLLKYFTGVRKSLEPGGIFFTDILGGSETMDAMKEKRHIPRSKAFDGTKIPAFTYVWDQARFNPVNHDFTCRIHFKLSDGTRIKRAFNYEWRLWTLPEIQELMLEAGFSSTEVYIEGWDDKEDDTDGVFRRKTHFENESAWVAYVVGLA